MLTIKKKPGNFFKVLKQLLPEKKKVIFRQIKAEKCVNRYVL